VLASQQASSRTSTVVIEWPSRETERPRVAAPAIEVRFADGHVLRVPVIDRLFIGRLCEGVSEEKRVVIRDTAVSRDHAVISRTRRGLTIRDTSTNGTRVNGVRGTTGSERPLAHGDSISIGTATLTVVAESLRRPTDTATQEVRTEKLSFDLVATHLVADVRGFSAAVERVDSRLVCSVMAKVFEDLSRIVHRHDGTVKDYAGDAIFAYWEHGESVRPERARDACQAALEQARAVDAIFSSISDGSKALRGLRMGWGLSTGRVTLSHYGVRSENIAVVGASANLAFELARAATRRLPSSIVVCQRTAQLVADSLPLCALAPVETKAHPDWERVFGLELGIGSRDPVRTLLPCR